jgi:hypothetical protein
LNQHSNGEEQDGCGEERPVSGKAHSAREPEEKGYDGYVKQKVAPGADPRSVVAANQSGPVNGIVADRLKADD